jgi:Cytochrome P450
VTPGPVAPVDLVAFETLLEPLGSWFERYGDVTRFVTAEGEGYSLCSPELASLVLREHARHFVRGWGVERVRLILPGGLLVDEGAAWKRHRALAQPLVHRQWLARHAQRAHHSAKALRDAWVLASHRGATIDVTTDTSLLALRCMLDVVFGAEAAQHSPLLALAQEQRRDLAFARRFRAFRPWVRELLASRPPPDSFLHGLVTADSTDGVPFSTEELVDQVLTFVIALRSRRNDEGPLHQSPNRPPTLAPAIDAINKQPKVASTQPAQGRRFTVAWAQEWLSPDIGYRIVGAPPMSAIPSTRTFSASRRLFSRGGPSRLPVQRAA